MTGKRFTIPKGYRVIKDNVTDEYATFYDNDDGETFLKWLNELYEENQTLYSQNKRLKEKIQRERNSFRETRERWSNEAENKIKELSGENGQLKKEVEDLKQAVIRAAFGG